tara:strand:- start:126 stop:416 length:291 start_codon:yes stop_codon:yes gene_type:complete
MKVLEYLDVIIMPIVCVLGALTIILLLSFDPDSASYQIICDSGFESPVTSVADIDNGVAVWSDPSIDKNEVSMANYFSRKMLPGEVCWINKVEDKS